MARLFLILALVFLGSVTAQSKPKTCMLAKGEEAIKACTLDLKGNWHTAFSRPIAYRLRAHAYYETEKYASAIKDYTIVIASPAATGIDWEFRGLAYWWLKKHDKALTDLTKAHALLPQDSNITYHLGSLQMELENNYEALKLFNALALQFPKHAEYHSLVSRLAIRLGLNDTALASAKRASDLSPKTAEYWYDIGYAEATLGRYDAAVLSFSQAILIKPYTGYLYAQRADAYYQQYKLDPAAEDYARALKENPKGHWHVDQAIVALAQGKTADAASMLKLARKNGQPEAEVLTTEGRALARAEKYKDAIAKYDRALKLKPDSAAASYWKGRSLAALGKYEPAISSYNQALKGWPRDAVTLADIADSQLELGQIDDAVASASQAATLSRNDPYVYETLSRAFSFKGQYKKSLENAEAALRIDGKRQTAMYRMAYALRQLGDAQAAIDAYTEMFKLGSDFTRGHIDRARAYLDGEKYDEAKADIDIAKKLGGDTSELQQLLGWYFELSRNPVEAFAAYDQAVKLDPKDGWAYESRGWGHMANDRPAAAIADCEKAISLLPKSPSPYRCLARAQSRMRKTDEAKQTLQAALKIDKSFGPAYFDLGYESLTASNYEDAIAQFSDAINSKTWLASSYLYRGDAYKAMGLKKAALRDYNLALGLGKGEFQTNVSLRIQQIDATGRFTKSGAPEYPQARPSRRQ